MLKTFTQTKAIGQTFHKGCLRCTECDARLGSGRVSERDARPYCHRCYAKVRFSSPQSQQGNSCKHDAVVWPARERICATGNLTRQRKEWDLNNNCPFRYDPFRFSAIDVKDEFPDVTSVHVDIQGIKSNDFKRNMAGFGQIQCSIVDHTPFRLSCDQHNVRALHWKKRERTSLGTERVTTNVRPSSLTLQHQLGVSSDSGVTKSGFSLRP